MPYYIPFHFYCIIEEINISEKRVAENILYDAPPVYLESNEPNKKQIFKVQLRIPETEALCTDLILNTITGSSECLIECRRNYNENKITVLSVKTRQADYGNYSHINSFFRNNPLKK